MWRARKSFPVLFAGNMYSRLQIARTFKEIEKSSSYRELEANKNG